MFGIVRKSEHDGNPSWQDQFKIPVIAIRGLVAETIIGHVRDIPASLSKEVRDQLADALIYNSAIRLVPKG